MADGELRHVAVVHVVHRAGRHRRVGVVPGLHHAAHAGPLPAAGDHRVGHQPLLHFRQPRDAGRPHRDDGHPAARSVRLRTEGRTPLLLPDLGHRAGRAARHRQPARLTAGARHPRVEGRARHGRGLRGRCCAPEDRRVRLCGAAGVHLRLAVCAPAALRQSDALRHQPGYRVLVHGGDRRRGQRLGRGAGRHGDHFAEAGAAEYPARSPRPHWQLRAGGVRHHDRAAAAVRARWHVAMDRPVAAAPAGGAGAGCTAAAGARPCAARGRVVGGGQGAQAIRWSGGGQRPVFRDSPGRDPGADRPQWCRQEHHLRTHLRCVAVDRRQDRLSR